MTRALRRAVVLFLLLLFFLFIAVEHRAGVGAKHGPDVAGVGVGQVRHGVGLARGTEGAEAAQPHGVGSVRRAIGNGRNVGSFVPLSLRRFVPSLRVREEPPRCARHATRPVVAGTASSVCEPHQPPTNATRLFDIPCITSSRTHTRYVKDLKTVVEVFVQPLKRLAAKGARRAILTQRDIEVGGLVGWFDWVVGWWVGWLVGWWVGWLVGRKVHLEFRNVVVQLMVLRCASSGFVQRH